MAERNGKIYECRQNAKRFKALTPDTIRLDELAGNINRKLGIPFRGVPTGNNCGIFRGAKKLAL